MNAEAQSTAAARWLRRLSVLALLVGVVALAIGGAAAFLSPAEFFPAYLFAYFNWIGLALGCLALAMLYAIVGGPWGAAILRLLEAGMSTLPLMVVLFAPIIAGLFYLYPWAREGMVGQETGLHYQTAYLNIPFFLVRAVLYLLLWAGMAYLLRRWSLRRDDDASPALVSRMRWLGAIGLVVFVLTTTFATIDWVMSLEPNWSSTIYSAMVMMGAVLSAFAFAIVVTAWLANRVGLVTAPALLNDLGSLLLAFVTLWAYLAFSQFMIIYAGDLVREIPWYIKRLQGGWEWLALAVAGLQFALPFMLLLFRDLKRSAGLLGVVAAVLVFARGIDVYWLIMPAFSPGGLTVHWLAPAVWVGIGGIWLALFGWQLARHPLFPRYAQRPVLTSEAELAREQG